MAEKKLVELPEPERLLELRDFLKRRIIGQPKSLEALLKKMGVYYSPLSKMVKHERKRPIGSFLFLGPTGVGKTETARRLAQFLTGYLGGLDRIDCENLGERHEVSKLIGAPPGYVGFEDDPQLSEEAWARKIADLRGESKNKNNDFKLTPGKMAQLLRRVSEVEAFKERREHLLEYIDFDRRYLSELKSSTDLMYQLSRKDSGRSKDRMNAVMVSLEGQISTGLESTLLDMHKLMKDIEDCNNGLTESEEELVSLLESEGARLKATPEGIAVVRVKKQNPEGGLDEDAILADDLPVRVILWDEIEKADPRIVNICLGILEEGEVQLAHGGNKGRNKEGPPRKATADLTKVIHIFSANVGAKRISEVLQEKGIGFKTRSRRDAKSDMKEYERRILSIAREEAKRHFPPEFINRLDGIIIFRPLDRDGLTAVLDVQVDEFNESLAGRKLRLELDPEVKNYVIKSSTQRLDGGARLIRHKMESLITLPLSRYVSEDIAPGTIRARIEGKELVFYHTQEE